MKHHSTYIAERCSEYGREQSFPLFDAREEGQWCYECVSNAINSSSLPGYWNLQARRGPSSGGAVSKAIGRAGVRSVSDEEFGDLCDFLDRLSTDYWEDEYFHTSDQARSAARIVIDMLGLELTPPGPRRP